MSVNDHDWSWKQFVQFLSRKSGSGIRVRWVKADLSNLLGDYLETWRNFSFETLAVGYRTKLSGFAHSAHLSELSVWDLQPYALVSLCTLFHVQISFVKDTLYCERPSSLLGPDCKVWMYVIIFCISHIFKVLNMTLLHLHMLLCIWIYTFIKNRHTSSWLSKACSETVTVWETVIKIWHVF